MKTVMLGAVLGVLVALAPAASLAILATVASQPLVWAFAAGVAARPRLARRFAR
ncbi:hypothetical protein ABZZ36_18315 [Actinacidiphila glaucinigra]|uniref:hypothetical protein n=1 Tax=Actinacidiphila glaucinigra TaxID=235986 RepID=UPI0033B2E1FB